MKKILLSTFVILSFILYSIYLSAKNPHVVSVTAKKPPLPRVVYVPTRVQSSPSPLERPKMTSAISGLKDGVYTGALANAVYGNVQVQIAVTNRSMTKVQFLQYPDDQSTSSQINQYADPILSQEAIQNQSTNVEIVSSATLTSNAFIDSLKNALSQAEQ